MGTVGYCSLVASKYSTDNFLQPQKVVNYLSEGTPQRAHSKPYLMFYSMHFLDSIIGMNRDIWERKMDPRQTFSFIPFTSDLIVNTENKIKSNLAQCKL